MKRGKGKGQEWGGEKCGKRYLYGSSWDCPFHGDGHAADLGRESGKNRDVRGTSHQYTVRCHPKSQDVLGFQ